MHGRVVVVAVAVAGGVAVAVTVQVLVDVSVAVVVEAVTDLFVARVGVELPVVAVVAAVGRVPAGRHVGADEIAVGVVVDLAWSQATVTVVVPAVAELRRAGVHRGVAVVAVAGADAPGVPVGVHLVRRHQAVAVVVEAVAELWCALVDRDVVVVAVVVTDALAVTVVVVLVVRHRQVAVVVQPVAPLDGSDVDLRVGVVAVEVVALVVAVEVVVDLVQGHSACAVVVQPIAELGGARMHRGLAVVAVRVDLGEACVAAGGGGQDDQLRPCPIAVAVAVGVAGQRVVAVAVLVDGVVGVLRRPRVDRRVPVVAVRGRQPAVSVQVGVERVAGAVSVDVGVAGGPPVHPQRAARLAAPEPVGAGQRRRLARVEQQPGPPVEVVLIAQAGERRHQVWRR